MKRTKDATHRSILLQLSGEIGRRVAEVPADIRSEKYLERVVGVAAFKVLVEWFEAGQLQVVDEAGHPSQAES